MTAPVFPPMRPVASAGRLASLGWGRKFRRTASAIRGFSLVELMLAVVLGLIVLAGVAQLFAGGRQTHALLNNQARLQESGRYALQFLGRSVRAAGYLGCNARPERIVNTLNGELGELFELDVRQAVAAFDGSGGGSVAAFAGVAGIDAGRVVPGTDILSLRRVQAPLHRVVAAVAPGGDPVVEKRGSFDLQADDFALIGDCEQSSLFRITGVVAGTGQATLLRQTGAGAYANSPLKTLAVPGKVYGPAGGAGGATVGRVVTETYFIARGRGMDSRGEPSRSLWRRTGTAAPAELVEGLHDLQVWFGVDTGPLDDVTGVNRQVRFNDVPSGAGIRTIYVRVAAGEPPDLRTFGQTFALRNAG